MSQTSVSSALAIGVAGLSVGSDNKSRPKVSAEASAGIPFGVMVAIDATNEDGGAVLLNTSAAAMAANGKLAGVVMFDHNYDRTSELDTDGNLKPKTSFEVMTSGRCLVRVEDAVDPGDAVRVRVVTGGAAGYGAAGAETKGAFRAAADSTDCVDISKFAQWRSSAAIGELAELEFDMTMVALAVADS